MLKLRLRNQRVSKFRYNHKCLTKIKIALSLFFMHKSSKLFELTDSSSIHNNIIKTFLLKFSDMFVYSIIKQFIWCQI